MRFLLLLVALVGMGGGGAWWWRSTHATDGTNLRMATVERRDLVVGVSATGTVQAEEFIDVGAQVQGRIQKLGPDSRAETDPAFQGASVDYRSEVEKDALLAIIDPAIYQAQRDQAQASLDRAKADVAQLEAKAEQAEAEWVRAQKLEKMTVSNPTPTVAGTVRSVSLPIQAISNSDYILAKANYQVAKANVDVGKAVVDQQKGVLELAETNLKYTVIQSPVKGTIIDRRVNVGQTVVSSLNAPSLFLIAKDLRRMQVWASVNEADIGQIQVDQPVTFTVDAFPDDHFKGKVKQVRYNATMTQNVVTYTVIVSVDNSDLKLIPYLTADVQFEVVRHDDVLVVPNTALRYQPQADKVIESSDSPATKSGRRSRANPNGAGVAAPTPRQGTIWVTEGTMFRPISVTLGVTDGVNTEVSGEGLDENLEVVVAEITDAPAAEQVNNPFAPRFPGRGGGGGGRGGGGGGGGGR